MDGPEKRVTRSSRSQKEATITSKTQGKKSALKKEALHAINNFEPQENTTRLTRSKKALNKGLKTNLENERPARQKKVEGPSEVKLEAKKVTRSMRSTKKKSQNAAVRDKQGKENKENIDKGSVHPTKQSVLQKSKNKKNRQQNEKRLKEGAQNKDDDAEGLAEMKEVDVGDNRISLRKKQKAVENKIFPEQADQNKNVGSVTTQITRRKTRSQAKNAGDKTELKELGKPVTSHTKRQVQVHIVSPKRAKDKVVPEIKSSTSQRKPSESSESKSNELQQGHKMQASTPKKRQKANAYKNSAVKIQKTLPEYFLSKNEILAITSTPARNTRKKPLPLQKWVLSPIGPSNGNENLEDEQLRQPRIPLPSFSVDKHDACDSGEVVQPNNPEPEPEMKIDLFGVDELFGEGQNRDLDRFPDDDYVVTVKNKKNNRNSDTEDNSDEENKYDFEEYLPPKKKKRKLQAETKALNKWAEQVNKSLEEFESFELCVEYSKAAEDN